MDELCAAVESGLENPRAFQKRVDAVWQRTEEAAYGGMADGKASERCYERLRKITGASR